VRTAPHALFVPPSVNEVICISSLPFPTSFSSLRSGRLSSWFCEDGFFRSATTITNCISKHASTAAFGSPIYPHIATSHGRERIVMLYDRYTEHRQSRFVHAVLPDNSTAQLALQQIDGAVLFGRRVSLRAYTRGFISHSGRSVNEKYVWYHCQGWHADSNVQIRWPQLVPTINLFASPREGQKAIIDDVRLKPYELVLTIRGFFESSHVMATSRDL
jgi:hypothetical protein